MQVRLDLSGKPAHVALVKFLVVDLPQMAEEVVDVPGVPFEVLLLRGSWVVQLTTWRVYEQGVRDTQLEFMVQFSQHTTRVIRDCSDVASVQDADMS